MTSSPRNAVSVLAWSDTMMSTFTFAVAGGQLTFDGRYRQPHRDRQRRNIDDDRTHQPTHLPHSDAGIGGS